MKMKRVDELNALELQQLVNDLGMKLHQRSEPIALAALETKEQWIAMASDPGHQHYMAARALIYRWVKADERMRAIAAGLSLPNA